MNEKFTNYFTIKEQHLDTFGHVNHATYLQILEEIRWDIISERGYSQEEIIKLQKGPVILDYNIKYKKELKNREEIKVESQVEKVIKKFMLFEQIIYKASGDIAAEAKMTIGFFDLKERKLLEPQQSWLQAIGVSKQ